MLTPTARRRGLAFETASAMMIDSRADQTGRPATQRFDLRRGLARGLK
jgi:hypothetical protein